MPHVHHRQTNPLALPLAQPVVELRHAGRRAILAAKPDRSASNQVAHHDPISMSFPDRDFVDADSLRPRRAGARQLGRHVLLVQCLDGLPVQVQFFGDILDGACATAPTHIPGESLGVERIVGKEIQVLPLHLAAASTQNSSHFEFQIDPRVATRQVAGSSRGAVVPARVRSATRLADSFFEPRTRVTMRAFESPNTPRTDTCARKPANLYASSRRFCLGKVTIAKSCQFPQHCQTAKTRIQQGTHPIS